MQAGQPHRHRAAPHLHPGPGRSSTVRRPSHHSTPCCDCGCTSTASTERGEVTSGLANSACALIGTISSASTSGQTTGPPAEKAYAVEPVGVAHTTPSQPKPDTGRPSTSMTTSSMRSRDAFSTDASLSAQSVCTTRPSLRTRTSSVIRSSTSYSRVTTRSTTLSRSSRSASARKPTRPRLTPSIGTPEARANSAPRSRVPSPPSTTISSQPVTDAGPARRRAPPRRAAAGPPPRPPAAAPLYRSAAGPARPARRCGSRPPAGVRQQEDGTVRVRVFALRRSTGPLRHGSVDVGRVQRGCAGAQPQKILDVPGRARQRAGRDAQRPPARAPRPVPPPCGRLSARSSGLRTTPPLPRRSLPTSNCGLTISTRSASGAAQRTSAGSTRPSGMKDRSPTTRSAGWPSIGSSVSSRTLVRSLTTTRSSLCSDQASCP